MVVVCSLDDGEFNLLKRRQLRLRVALINHKAATFITNNICDPYYG